MRYGWTISVETPNFDGRICCDVAQGESLLLTQQALERDDSIWRRNKPHIAPLLSPPAPQAMHGNRLRMWFKKSAGQPLSS